MLKKAGKTALNESSAVTRYGVSSGVRLSGAARSAQIMLDLFSTDASAPLLTPRTCEPGPGTLTLTQNDGQFSTSGGKLVIPAQTTNTTGDLRFDESTARARARGLSVSAKNTVSTFASLGWAFGWFGGTTVGVFADCAECWWFRTNTMEIIPNLNGGGNPNTLIVPLLNVEYTLETVLRSPGAFYLIRGGIYCGRLLWVSHVNTTASVKAGLSNNQNVGTLDDLAIVQRGGGFTTQNGLADAVVATPATGEIITHRADGLIEFTWTAATGETLDLMFRRTDDDNCWIVRCSQAGSTYKLIEKVGGTETERRSAAVTFTNGTAYRIMIVFDAQTVGAWVNNVLGWSIWTESATGMNATTAKASGFTTGTNFIAWPGYVNPGTGAGVKPDLLVFDGNSMVIGTGVTINYPDRTMAKIQGYATRLNFGVGGATWADMIADAATQIDTLYNSDAHARNVVICWEGTNSLGAGLTAAQVITAMESYCTARRAAGWSVVVLTILPRGDASKPANFEENRQTINSYIRSNYASFATALADIAADSRIGDAGCENNTDYYNADKLHMSDGGYEIVSQIVKLAIDRA